MMTGTVARGGWGTSAGRVRGWGRDGKREGRTREVRTRMRRTVQTRARETPRADVPRAVRARPVRRHFDVVKSMGAKRDRVARASAEARGETPRGCPPPTPAAAVEKAAKRAMTGSRDAAPGARVPRAPRAARGKGRQSADDGRPQGGGSRVEARTFSVRDVRVAKARALASPFP